MKIGVSGHACRSVSVIDGLAQGLVLGKRKDFDGEEGDLDNRRHGFGGCLPHRGMLLERGERPVIFDVALNERLLNAVGVDTGKVSMIRGNMFFTRR